MSEEVTAIDIIKESWIALGAYLMWALRAKSVKFDKLNEDVIKLKAVAASKEEVRDIVKEETAPIKKSTEKIEQLVTDIQIALAAQHGKDDSDA